MSAGMTPGKDVVGLYYCPDCKKLWRWAVKSEEKGGYICHTCGKPVEGVELGEEAGK